MASKRKFSDFQCSKVTFLRYIWLKLLLDIKVSETSEKFFDISTLKSAVNKNKGIHKYINSRARMASEPKFSDI